MIISQANQRPHRHRLAWSAKAYGVGFLTLLCVACREDPELTKKRDQQVLKIAEIRQQLLLAEMKLKQKPDDVAIELKYTESKLIQLEEEAKDMEAVIIDLKEKKQSMEQVFAEYRDKYPIQ